MFRLTCKCVTSPLSSASATASSTRAPPGAQCCAATTMRRPGGSAAWNVWRMVICRQKPVPDILS
eukprot:scaffold4787_cov117-Isochrysis_galbana.AAC.1